MTDTVPADGKPIINDNGQIPGPAAPAAEEAWWKEASEKHGFKSKEDVYKSWSEAQKKISDDGEQLKNFKIFQDSVVPVLDVVLQDEEILGKVKSKMENPNQTPKAPAPQVEKVPVEDADTKKYLIDNIVQSFEQKHGIDKLDEETQKEIKAKVGTELKKFTSGGDLKVNALPRQLEDAFALATATDEKMKELFSSKDDTLGDYGSLPSQSSGGEKNSVIRLTPEQEKVAERMPGGREAYINGLKKIQGN